MHFVLVNHLSDLSLSRNSVVRLTSCPDMTIAVYCRCKAIKQQKQYVNYSFYASLCTCTDK